MGPDLDNDAGASVGSMGYTVAQIRIMESERDPSERVVVYRGLLSIFHSSQT